MDALDGKRVLVPGASSGIDVAVAGRIPLPLMAAYTAAKHVPGSLARAAVSRGR